MAKTKEMLSKQYLKNDLAYQLHIWFVDWSWDPLDAYCFWINYKLVLAKAINQKGLGVATPISAGHLCCQHTILV